MKKQVLVFGVVISLLMGNIVHAAPTYNYTTHPAASQIAVDAELSAKEAALDDRVPYSGATQDVDLTGYILSADNIIGEQCQDRFEDTLDASGWYNIVSNDIARIGFGSYGVFTIKWQVGSFQDSVTFRVALDDTASSSVTMQLLSGAFSSTTVRVPRVRIYKKEGESAFQVALYYDHTGLSSPTEFNILLKEGENFPLNSAFSSPRVTFQMPSPDEWYILETTNALAVRGDGETEFFVVNKNAQVGIGTATPTAALDVVGDAGIMGNIDVTGNILLDGNIGIGTTTPISKMHLDGGGVSTAFSFTNKAWINVDTDGWITTPGMDVFGGDLELWNETPASDSIFYLYGQTEYYTMGTKYIDNDPDPDSDEFWISSGQGFANPDFVMDNTGSITIADLTATSFSSPDVVPYTGATSDLVMGDYTVGASKVSINTASGADDALYVYTKLNGGNIFRGMGTDNSTFIIDADGDLTTTAGTTNGLGGGATFAGDVILEGGFVTEGGNIVYDNFYHNWIVGDTLFGEGTASPADRWYDFVVGSTGGIEIFDDYTTWANGVYLSPNYMGLDGAEDQKFEVKKASQSFTAEVITDLLRLTYNGSVYQKLVPITKDTYDTVEITYGQKNEQAAPYKYSDDVFVGDVSFERDVNFDADIYVSGAIVNQGTDGDMYYQQKGNGIGYGHIFTYWNSVADVTLLDLDAENGADFQSFAITTTGDLTAANIVTAGLVDGVDVSDLSASVITNAGNISTNTTALSSTPTIEVGTDVPTSTPTKVGDIYVDTTNKKLYFATGITSSADWTIAN